MVFQRTIIKNRRFKPIIYNNFCSFICQVKAHFFYIYIILRVLRITTFMPHPFPWIIIEKHLNYSSQQISVVYERGKRNPISMFNLDFNLKLDPAYLDLSSSFWKKIVSKALVPKWLMAALWLPLMKTEFNY